MFMLFSQVGSTVPLPGAVPGQAQPTPQDQEKVNRFDLVIKNPSSTPIPQSQEKQTKPTWLTSPLNIINVCGTDACN